MEARRRRALWGLAGLVATLVLGRWMAVFATNRLWEGRVSEAAALVGTRFALLEAALELIGLASAIAWFGGHFFWVTRSVMMRFAEPPRNLATWPPRAIYWIAAGAATVLGVAVGGGTGSWLPTILVARTGVTFGVADSLLHTDLGLFAARLPLWELLYDRAADLLIPAIVAVMIANLFGGNIKVVERRLWISPNARWQTALLLIATALLIGWGSALTPYRLAVDQSAAIGPAEFLLRATVSQVIVLFAATAAVLTFLWAVRFRFVVAAGGWVGLGLASLGGSILTASRAAGGPLGAQELVALRRVDSVAYGLRLSRGTGPVQEGEPALWDRTPLGRIAATDSARVSDVLPGLVRVGPGWNRVWMVIRTVPNGEPTAIAVADDRTGPTGGIASLRWGDETFSPGIVPYLTLTKHSIRPGAPEFDLATTAPGVPLYSAIRRLAIAWALQVGPALRAEPNQQIAWRLDPVQRLEALAPFAEWSRPTALAVGRELYWLCDGFVTLDQFPGSRRAIWRGREVGYVGAGFVGLVRARGGDVRIFLRPDADSLSAAWAEVAAPLIEPAASLPTAVSDNLGAPRWLTAVQTQVLQGTAWLGVSAARQGPLGGGDEGILRSGTLADPLRLPFLSADGQRVTALLVSPAGSVSEARVISSDTALAVGSPRDLQQRWERFPFFQQLRDSVRAAGSDYVPGLIRFTSSGDTLVAFQPSYAIGPAGGGAAVLVNVALGSRLGAGRTYQEAWQNLRGEVAPSPVGTDIGTRLTQARTWLDRADEALKRGDLEAFGRAFAYLRELLRVTGGATPEPKP